MIDFSVIVATYHASKEQLERTLSSVLEQEQVKFEIIVCDDASEDNHFDWIKKFFHERQFERYHLLGSTENLGTVRNMLRGLRVAEGTYAKLIGAGDMLYCTSTLYEVRAFMENENLDCCFGRMQGFRIRQQNRECIKHVSPRDLDAYRFFDQKRIVKNLLVSEDWVSGAGIFAKTSYYIKYISMLENKVIYCEDWATALALVDHIYMKFYDGYVVWYEVGEGVSTTPNAEWRTKLLHDREEFWHIFEQYAMMQKNSEFDKENRLRERKKRADKLGGKYFGVLLKAITNPALVAFELRARRQERKE